MLRIKVELVPFGNETKKRTIGEMLVANVGGDALSADYAAIIAPDAWTSTPALVADIKNHDRMLSVWQLVAKVINKAVDKAPQSEVHETLLKRLENRSTI